MRTAVDWDRMDERTFETQNDPARPHAFLSLGARERLPARFQEHFEVDYFRYRSELARRARACLGRVEGATVTIGLSTLERWLYAEPDELLCPIDDDDLLAPDLVAATRVINPSTGVLVWCHVMAGFADFEHTPRVQRRWYPFLLTNNWAVRKSFLRQRFDLEGCRRFLSDHRAAQAMLLADLGIPHDPSPWAYPLESLFGTPVQTLGRCLSVDFMHVGSLQFFATLCGRGDVRAEWDAYRLDLPIEVPDWLAWAAADLHAMHGTIPRLRGR